MKALLQQITIEVSPKVYLKEPYSSDLGKSIVRDGVLLINEIGLEAFTFKKLAHRMCTTESSIYRYFENKHKFLLYLIDWYWGWLEYEIVMATTNLGKPEEELSRMLHIMCDPIADDLHHQHLDLHLLHKIVIEESPKAFFTKEVEIDNQNGLFKGYKRVVSRLADAITATHENYPYSLSLATTAIETINQQQFLGEHFPRMSSLGSSNEKLTKYIKGLVLRTINN